MKNIWICGDSILRGVVWQAETGRYTTTDGLGYTELGEQYGLTVVNRSRFGCTVDRGCAQLLSKLEAGKKCDIALLEYGGNDCDFAWREVAETPDAEHLPHTPIERYERIYRDTVRQLRARGILVGICNLVPVCAHRYLEWVTRDGTSRENILHWLGDENAIYRYQERYSRTAERLAREEGCTLVDLRGAFLCDRRMEPYFCPDGIHPNEQGQALLREVFADTLEHATFLRAAV